MSLVSSFLNSTARAALYLYLQVNEGTPGGCKLATKGVWWIRGIKKGGMYYAAGF